MKTTFLPIALVASAALLAACGGGGNDDSPAPTAQSATATVSVATVTALNGIYSTGQVSLTGVEKTDPLNAGMVCSFRFAGLQQAGSSRLMSGDIRYDPLSANLRTTFVTIDTVEYVLSGSAGAAVDRANNRVVYTNAVFTGSNSTGGALTLNATIPMRSPRPVDC